MPDDGAGVVEAEPGEVFENGGIEFGPAALAIVVLDAEQDLAVAIVGGLPDVEGVDDVSQMKKAGRGRREPCNHTPLENTLPPFEAAEGKGALFVRATI